MAKPATYTSPIEIVRADAKEQHVVIGGSQESADEIFAKWAKAERRKGATVRYPDGTSKWERLQAIRENGECVWHEDGNRIRAQRIEYTRTPDGNVTSKPFGRKLWVLWETVN